MNAPEHPLLHPFQLPPFDRLRPEDVEPVITELIARARAAIDHAMDERTPPTWEDFVAPLEHALEQLSDAWGVIGHLHSVMDTPAWREAYNKLLPEVTRFWTELGQNEALYRKTQALAQSPEFARLSPERRRVIELDLRDHRLAGAELPPEKKPRHRDIQQELSAIAARFSENVLDATNAYQEWIEDEAQLSGIPEEVRAMAREAAQAQNRPGWCFTLQMPFYLPVMQYADDRSLRERIVPGARHAGSELAPPTRRQRPAHRTHPGAARRRGATAGLPRLRQLLARAQDGRPSGGSRFLPAGTRRPRQALRPARPGRTARLRPRHPRARSARTVGHRLCLGKLRQARYDYSEQEVRRYLPLPRVLEGLFALLERLFGVRLVPDTAPVWHPDVTFYRVERDGAPIAYFYVDLYARDTKRGGAWMDSAKSRRREDESLMLPVAYLVCNFAPPVDGTPPTLTHDDVLTLFHEMGHGLHHMLTQVDEAPISGIHHVEWDAVELPSQFMENFAWEWEVLQHITAHVDTGEPLPRPLYEKMRAAKNFQAGMQMVRQIEFSLFDLRIHRELAKAQEPAPERVPLAEVLRILEEVRDEVAVIRRRIGIVFQDFRLLDHFTTYENVALPLRVLGKEETSYRAEVTELLHWVGLGDRMHVMPPVLSGGEKQRVAIGSVLTMEPLAIALDEPTLGLGHGMKEKLAAILRSAHGIREGRSRGHS